MHEVGVAQRIVTIAVEAAQANGSGKIVALRLLLGTLTCVDPQTLTFAFDIAARGTPAAGARLEIVRMPAALRCAACGCEQERDLAAPCTACGAHGGSVIRGRELHLDSIDVDDDNQPEPGEP